jgi:hypothetical protein
MRNEFDLSSRTGVRACFMALMFARGSRAVAPSTASDAVHGAFMTLPPYTQSREGEGHELGLGVRSCLHSARSDPVEASRERIERACEGTSAPGTARCASRGPVLDVTVSLAEVASGYRAMDQRQAIKALVRP